MSQKEKDRRRKAAEEQTSASQVAQEEGSPVDNPAAGKSDEEKSDSEGGFSDATILNQEESYTEAGEEESTATDPTIEA